MACISRG